MPNLKTGVRISAVSQAWSNVFFFHGGFYGPGALVSLGRRRRATGRPEKCIFHAHAKENGGIGPLLPQGGTPI